MASLTEVGSTRVGSSSPFAAWGKIAQELADFGERRRDPSVQTLIGSAANCARQFADCARRLEFLTVEAPNIGPAGDLLKEDLARFIGQSTVLASTAAQHSGSARYKQLWEALEGGRRKLCPLAQSAVEVGGGSLAVVGQTFLDYLAPLYQGLSKTGQRSLFPLAIAALAFGGWTVFGRTQDQIS